MKTQEKTLLGIALAAALTSPFCFGGASAAAACADGRFLISKEGFRKAFYLELDRDTTREASRVAAQKTPGYAMLAEVNGHLRHFPTANVAYPLRTRTSERNPFSFGMVAL